MDRLCIFLWPRQRPTAWKRHRQRTWECERGSWPICSSELPLQAFGHVLSSVVFHWRDDAAVRAHTRTESLTWIRTYTFTHVKPCLICKGKLRVMRAVPAADCGHASLPSSLWAQTMTTQHYETPEHQSGVRSGLEDSQLQHSPNRLLLCSWFYYFNKLK